MSGRFLMWLLTSFVGTLLLSTYLGLKGAVILVAVLLFALILVLFFHVPLKSTVIACLISSILGVGLFASAEIPAARIEASLLNQECAVSGTVVAEGKNSAKTLDRYKVRLHTVK